MPISSHSLFSLLPRPWCPLFYFLSVDLPILDITYKLTIQCKKNKNKRGVIFSPRHHVIWDYFSLFSLKWGKTYTHSVFLSRSVTCCWPTLQSLSLRAGWCAQGYVQSQISRLPTAVPQLQWTGISSPLHCHDSAVHAKLWRPACASVLSGGGRQRPCPCHFLPSCCPTACL